MSVAVTGAVLYGAIFVAVWWAAGRWFSVVLFLDVLPVAMAVIVDALGIDIGSGAISILPIVGATLVGLLAARLDRRFCAPITGVEPATLSLCDTVAGELAAAGFHDRPDVACGYDGHALVIGAYAHRTEPVYAQVIVRPKMAQPVSGWSPCSVTVACSRLDSRPLPGRS